MVGPVRATKWGVPKMSSNAIHQGSLGRRAAAVMLVQIVLAGPVAPPAMAQGWVRLLRDTPAENFDDEDLRLFLDASRTALNDAADTVVVPWHNPASGNGGDFTAVRSFRRDGHPCREMRLRYEAGGKGASHVVDLCRIDGRWRALSPSQKRP
jgi:surface antigen